MAMTWYKCVQLRQTGYRTLAKTTRTLLPVSAISSNSYSTVIAFQKNKKGTNEEPKKKPFKEVLKFAAKNFGPELKLFYKEQKDNLARTPLLELEHGNYEVIHRFNDRASVDSWVCSTDSDSQIGYSTAQFTYSKNRTGLFHGYLNKAVPKDGKTKYSGYANITSPRCRKSFFRETDMDWSLFNCMLLRVRGDGRPYHLNIGCNFHFDVNWLCRWSFPLFTRGGPYWQVAKIPLSKLFLTHSGRIQDTQEILPLEIVNSLGITVMDMAEGPFSLEIDSIALMYDVNLSDVHAYELYQNKWYEVNS